MSRKTFPVLYKQGTKGQTVQWQIEVDGNRFRTTHGQKDGKLVTDEWTTCEGKNLGRTNATTGEQQAMKEAEAKFADKLKKRYAESVEDADQKAIDFSCMLAENFAEFSEEVTFPCHVQPKLDGVRCYAQDGKLISRLHNEFVSCPHIVEAIGQTPWILDGELYNHDLKDDFDELVGMIKKKNISDEILLKTADKVEFWVYDVYSSSAYTERWTQLHNTFANVPGPIKVIPTVVCRNMEEVLAAYEKFLEEGYEGAMIRWGEEGYQEKRTKYLLKHKPFIDEEFDIVGSEEGIGNRKGTIGKVICVTEEGKRFKANVKGKRAYITEMWNRRDELPGKRGTIRYQNRTPDGIPRFGRMTAVREYE